MFAERGCARFFGRKRKRGLTPARIERTTLWTGITRSTTELRGHVRFSVVRISVHKARLIIVPGTRPLLFMTYYGLRGEIWDGDHGSPMAPSPRDLNTRTSVVEVEQWLGVNIQYKRFVRPGSFMAPSEAFWYELSLLPPKGGHRNNI